MGVKLKLLPLYGKYKAPMMLQEQAHRQLRQLLLFMNILPQLLPCDVGNPNGYRAETLSEVSSNFLFFEVV
jgi:hypothetical protein